MADQKLGVLYLYDRDGMGSMILTCSPTCPHAVINIIGVQPLLAAMTA